VADSAYRVVGPIICVCAIDIRGMLFKRGVLYLFVFSLGGGGGVVVLLYIAT